jgi:hypothetical protein
VTNPQTCRSKPRSYFRAVRVMVTRQRLRVGAAHAGKTVTIRVEDTHFRVLLDGEELGLHPRTDNRPVTRFRAYATRSTDDQPSSMS